MSNSEDSEVVNVVAVTVCERIGGHQDLLPKAQHFMGPLTRQISDDIEKGFGT